MTKSKIRFVNLYEKLLSLPIHDEEISLAHGQVPNEISLARCEKALAPGVGQWDLSAPGPIRMKFLRPMSCHLV